MRWNPPETLGAYMDDPIALDIGALVIGVCCIVGACSILILIGALPLLVLRVLGWR